MWPSFSLLLVVKQETKRVWTNQRELVNDGWSQKEGSCRLESFFLSQANNTDKRKHDENEAENGGMKAFIFP